jgi:hypothetical protein
MAVCHRPKFQDHLLGTVEYVRHRYPRMTLSPAGTMVRTLILKRALAGHGRSGALMTKQIRVRDGAVFNRV